MDSIIRKLTSRKFWAAVASFVTMIMIYRGRSEGDAQQVAALIMAGASVIAYIIGEGLADAAGAGGENAVFIRAPDIEEQQPPDSDD